MTEKFSDAAHVFMPLINLHQHSIYYESYGKGDPLLLIGGFTNHIEIWEPLLPFLEKKFFVVAFDNRGAGRSSARPPYSITQFSNDTIALMDHLALPSASVVSLSMGTLILQDLALRFGHKINRSVMISPFSALPATAHIQAQAQLSLLQAGVDPALVMNLLLPWLYSSTFLSDPQRVSMLIDKMKADPYFPTKEGYQGQLNAMQAADFTNQLASVSTPLLLLAGEEDICILPETAKKMAHTLPHADLKLIPHTAHLPHIEHPHLVFEAIAAFFNLKRTDATTNT